MTRTLQLTDDEADLIVSALAERAVGEMTAGREKQAHAALNLAETISGAA